MSKKTITPCSYCGKEFEHYQSENRKYCSKSCSIKDRGRDTKVKTTCNNCGKEFECYPSQNRKYCSKSCASRDRNYNNINYSKENNKIKTTCNNCGKEFEYRKSRTKGKYCSRTCANKYRSKPESELKEFRDFRRSRKWRRVRKVIKKRDNYTCQECGIHEAFLTDDWKYLEVHHIVPVSQGGNKYDERNLISLCTDCHNDYHT